MGVRKITLNKVEMAQVVLTELIACVDVDEPRRAALRNALDLVTSLRPVADSPAQHTPVLWAPGIAGCSCGYRPDHPAGRISTLFGAYHSHLARLGIPRSGASVRAVYGFGPKIGQPL